MYPCTKISMCVSVCKQSIRLRAKPDKPSLSFSYICTRWYLYTCMYACVYVRTVNTLASVNCVAVYFFQSCNNQTVRGRNSGRGRECRSGKCEPPYRSLSSRGSIDAIKSERGRDIWPGCLAILPKQCWSHTFSAETSTATATATSLTQRREK